MNKITKEEYEIALKVLESFEPILDEMHAAYEEDEYAHEMSRGLEVWTEILSSKNPQKWLENHLEEIKLSH
jgi:hypothetical protein